MLKRTLIKCLCICFTLLILDTYYALAVTTTVWEQSSYKDFSDGKPRNVSLTSKDEVTLSRSLVPVDDGISELRIWCLASDSQGNIYAGTGDKGKIFKVAKSGEVSLIFDSPETDILSLVVDNSGNIYAGASPDGLIYRIKPDQVPETFFNTGEKYVWSLAFDKSGNLYAGTGIAGKLFKVSSDGKGEVIYDSNETHIKCVLSDGENIYAGTEGSGIIYRISPSGDVFVLYDTPEREISSLVMDASKELYASAVAGEAVPPSREPSEQGPPPPSGRDRGGEERRALVYQITPDGVATKIWQSPDPLIFSMMLDEESLLVGTGNEGNLYSVNTKGDWLLLADCQESQVLSLHSGEGIWLATGNPAKLYKISSDYVKEGTLESQKHDAGVISGWGNISWEAIRPEGTTVTLSTRSGNTEKPDDTWSNWSEEYTDSAGTPIKSPPARFIQWQAKLTSADGKTTPILKRVSVSYLQKNLKPVIESVTISDDQEKGEEPPKRQPGRGPEGEAQRSEKVPLSGKKTIKWQAKDPNGDQLEYSVFFRGIDEKNWKLMKKELKVTSHQFDTESFPDGTYLFRVCASDSPNNPGDLALSEEKDSEPFDIDNTPPKVVDLQAKFTGDNKYTVSGKIEDTTSIIKSIVYSIDGGDWKPAFPSDQILDSKVEYLSFSASPPTIGDEHIIVVKATDAAGNVGAAKTAIQTK